MKLNLVNIFGAEMTEDGRMRIASAPFRMIGASGGTLPVFTECGPKAEGEVGPEISKADYARCISPADKRTMNWIWGNCETHAPFVNKQTSLTTQFGKYYGKTLVFVLCGPSAAGIDERIAPYRDHPDFYVATLNLSAKAVTNPDFHCCFEQLCPVDYYEHLDPEKTTLLTTPMAGSPMPHKSKLAEMWGGRNVFYSYMGDMRQPTDERWESLPLLFSALHTAIPSLQAFYHMGFTNILIVGADYSMANPKFDTAFPGQILEADWYFDGSMYRADKGNMGKCYYNGARLLALNGVNGDMCAAPEMLVAHCECTRVCMEILEEAGINVCNCSEQGILDVNVANLESELDRVLAPMPQLQEVG